MVKIRMKKMGAKKRPYYRIVVIDSQNARDGKFIEQVGTYHPILPDAEQLKFDAEKIKKWFLEGAQTSTIVRKMLNKKNSYFARQKLLAK
jgi:small subunit ribosomal protein S16